MVFSSEAGSLHPWAAALLSDIRVALEFDTAEELRNAPPSQENAAVLKDVVDAMPDFSVMEN